MHNLLNRFSPATIECFGDRQFCHSGHGRHVGFRLVGEHKFLSTVYHLHSFGLAIVIGFISTHLNTPAVIDWDRKQKGYLDRERGGDRMSSSRFRANEKEYLFAFGDEPFRIEV